MANCNGLFMRRGRLVLDSEQEWPAFGVWLDGRMAACFLKLRSEGHVSDLFGQGKIISQEINSM